MRATRLVHVGSLLLHLMAVAAAGSAAIQDRKLLQQSASASLECNIPKLVVRTWPPLTEPGTDWVKYGITWSLPSVIWPELDHYFIHLRAYKQDAGADLVNNYNWVPENTYLVPSTRRWELVVPRYPAGTTYKVELAVSENKCHTEGPKEVLSFTTPPRSPPLPPSILSITQGIPASCPYMRPRPLWMHNKCGELKFVVLPPPADATNWAAEVKKYRIDCRLNAAPSICSSPEWEAVCSNASAVTAEGEGVAVWNRALKKKHRRFYAPFPLIPTVEGVIQPSMFAYNCTVEAYSVDGWSNKSEAVPINGLPDWPPVTVPTIGPVTVNLAQGVLRTPVCCFSERGVTGLTMRAQPMGGGSAVLKTITTPAPSKQNSVIAWNITAAPFLLSQPDRLNHTVNFTAWFNKGRFKGTPSEPVQHNVWLVR